MKILADKHYLQIRLAALEAVLRPLEVDHLRAIFRYYAKNFSTPLHVVEELPLEDVLIHYYESIYEQYSQEELREELELLNETPEQRSRRIREEDARAAEDVQFLRSVRERALNQEQEEKQKAESPPPASAAAAVEEPLPPIPEDVFVQFSDPEIDEDII